jgi:hypothetical protein
MASTRILDFADMTFGFSNMRNAVPEIKSFSTGDQKTNRIFGRLFFDLASAGSLAAYKEPSKVRGGLELNAYTQWDPGYSGRNASGVGLALRICVGGGGERSKAVSTTNYPPVHALIADEAPNSRDLRERYLEKLYPENARRKRLKCNNMNIGPLPEGEGSGCTQVPNNQQNNGNGEVK